MSLRNVLVTGASTPLGERLIWRLLEDSRVNSVVAACDEHEPLAIPENDRLKMVAVDMRKQRRIHSLLFGVAKEWCVDTLVHTAHEESAIKEGAKVRQHNVESLRSILSFAERHSSIKRLVIRSFGEVYQVQRDLPVLIGEDHPLNMNSGAPQFVRDRVEADLTACARMGLSSLQIVVLRMAEILAPSSGSQMFDYLQSVMCFRPVGYDPMLNFLSLEDAAASLQRAIHQNEQGVFNVPGADTLPLSKTIQRWGRVSVPTPETVLSAIYRVRRVVRGAEFRYGMNRRRFHYSGVLDGRRAMEVLKYIPSYPIDWPLSDIEAAES